jgi:hypothetical protein
MDKDKIKRAEDKAVSEINRIYDELTKMNAEARKRQLAN